MHAVTKQIDTGPREVVRVELVRDAATGRAAANPSAGAIRRRELGMPFVAAHQRQVATDVRMADPVVFEKRAWGLARQTHAGLEARHRGGRASHAARSSVARRGRAPRARTSGGRILVYINSRLVRTTRTSTSTTRPVARFSFRSRARSRRARQALGVPSEVTSIAVELKAALRYDRTPPDVIAQLPDPAEVWRRRRVARVAVARRSSVLSVLASLHLVSRRFVSSVPRVAHPRVEPRWKARRRGRGDGAHTARRAERKSATSRPRCWRSHCASCRDEKRHAAGAATALTPRRTSGVRIAASSERERPANN
jgi:hypothetical protein